MARQIARLAVGEKVTLKFQTRGGSYEEENFFWGLSEDGDYATFRTAEADPNVPNATTYTWQAYRFNGRWCYGSSAQRLSIVA